MAQKKLIAAIFIKDETAYTDAALKVQVNKDLSVKELCVKLYENGVDAIIYSDLSYDDESHEKAILNLREICKEVDIPVQGTFLFLHTSALMHRYHTAMAGIRL